MKKHCCATCKQVTDESVGTGKVNVKNLTASLHVSKLVFITNSYNRCMCVHAFESIQKGALLDLKKSNRREKCLAE